MAQITLKITFKDERRNVIESISDSQAMAAVIHFNGGNHFGMGITLTLLIGDEVKDFRISNFETYFYKNTMETDGEDSGKSHNFNSETVYYLELAK